MKAGDYMDKRKDERAYYWTTVCYPESLPKDWLMILRNTHIQFVVSPLHDADKNADDTEKKAHYHILFCFESLKSYTQVKTNFCDPINAVIPKVVMSVRGLIRYFAHLDNPEKTQYPVEDIQAYNGACIDDLLKQTTTEKHKILRQILTFIEDNDILDFSELVLITMQDKDTIWFDFLADNYTIFIGEFLKSRRCKYAVQKRKEKKA